MKEFKKENLKFGDIVTYRNGKQNIINRVDNYKIYYYDDLKPVHLGKGFDIMRVERYERTAMSDKLYGLKILYERKEDILDAKEKEYLSNVIRPFRNRVKYIKKCNLTSEYISIWYEDIINGSDNFSLPYFKKGTMYKNMELNEAYSLEELGL